MPTQSPQQAPIDAAAERDARIHRLGAEAWSQMTGCGALPTPRNFGLWCRALEGAHTQLGRRLSALLADGASPDEAALDALQDGCDAPGVDIDAVDESSEAVQSVAQDVLDQVAGNGEGLRAYGAALAHWSVRLRQDRTMEGLAHAVATLTAETAKASERNRILEQQLSVSAARIARLKEALAEVRQEATTDALTGLCNRKAFDARLRRAVSRARAGDAPFGLLMIDVDHFKRFNDVHGHAVGDLVLRLVARLLSANVKGRDTAARYGGEEFAVLLEGAELAGALAVAEQIRAGLDGKRLVTKGAGCDVGGVTVSVGVAQFRSGETAATVLSRADVELYRAKHLGRNRVCAEEDLEAVSSTA